MRKSEDRLQSECFQWFHNSFPDLRMLLWAVPNGGKRNKQEAAKLKATGVVKGVHDLHMFYKYQFYTFELKVGNNKESKEQAEFGLKIMNNGGMCFEVREFVHFKALICNILKLNTEDYI